MENCGGPVFHVKVVDSRLVGHLGFEFHRVFLTI